MRYLARVTLLASFVLLMTAVFGNHSSHAQTAPEKPKPSSIVNGRPVYDMETLKKTPGVHFTREVMLTTPLPVGQTSTASPYSASYGGSSSAVRYGSYPYQTIIGTAYQYSYINIGWFYSTPLCISGETTTYVYPNYVQAQYTGQLYYSTYGFFGAEQVVQGFTSYGYADANTLCYYTSRGDTWYQLSNFTCWYPYSCGNADSASWTDNY